MISCYHGCKISGSQQPLKYCDGDECVLLKSNRVPKCDVIENEICEIMGFVKIF